MPLTSLESALRLVYMTTERVTVAINVNQDVTYGSLIEALDATLASGIGPVIIDVPRTFDSIHSDIPRGITWVGRR